MSSYLGNARNQLILGPNTRDDIIPDGISSTFELSQEVPGGDGSNIFVLKSTYTSDQLISSSNQLVFDDVNNSISTTNTSIASTLSSVQPQNFINITNSTANDGIYEIVSVSYTGTQCTIFLNGNIVVGDSLNPSVILSYEYYTEYNILDTETDYTLSGTNSLYNKVLNLSSVPNISDKIYVLHKGSSTYNFQPSQNSVGPDQLTPNLRNFVVDRFTGDNIQVNFNLSQPTIDSKSLLVTVDGEISDGDSTGFSTGEWQLTETVPSSNIFDRITFDIAPVNLVKIRVLHLGFSTISRRAVYSPNQSTLIVPPSSVGSVELQNNSITANKLTSNVIVNSSVVNDAIDGTKILLNNNQPLRSKNSSNVSTPILTLDNNNDLILSSPSEIVLEKTIKPSSNTDLGTISNKFDTLHIETIKSDTLVEVSDGVDTTSIDKDSITTKDLNISGNITVSGTVDGVDISALQNQVNINSFGFPVGAVIPFAGSLVPNGWLLCDGSSYSTGLYPSLFSVIGYIYGGTGPNFTLPDMRQYIPIGKNSSGIYSTLGQKFGQIDHTHEVPDHTHDDTHTHNIPAHFHSMGSGADLNITSSGNHTTSLNHTHTATVASSGAHEHLIGTTGQSASNTRQVFASSETLIPSGILPGRNPLHSHNINVSTSNNITNHTHTVDTVTENTPTLSEHTHNVKTVALENAQNLGSSTDYHFVVAEAPSTINIDINSGNDGIHTHDYTIVSTTESIPHTHNLSTSTSTSGAHDHVIRGTVPDTNSSHTHSVSISNLTSNSSSTGEHVHISSNFSGRIGNVVSSNDGNTGFASQARSVPTTGNISNPGPGTTTSSNPPCICLNFLIKV